MMKAKRLPIGGLFPRSPILWVLVMFSGLAIAMGIWSYPDLITLLLILVTLLLMWTSFVLGGVWDFGSEIRVWQGLWWVTVPKEELAVVDYRFKMVRPNRPSLCLILRHGKSVLIPRGIFRTADDDLDAIVTITSAAAV